MPEGPEIRRAADRVAEVLVGHAVVEAVFAVPALKPFEPALSDRLVTAVDTHGKAMLTRFDNGLTLYSHNQLYGRWFTTKRPDLPRTSRQLRVALHTATHSALLYSASGIEVLNAREIAVHPFLSRLGPDILDAELTVECILERLDSTPFKNRALGGLYLDQRFLAGNGNYLRSEILWSAAADPAARPRAMTAAAQRRLARETLRIARRSYRTGGITVPQRRVARLKSRGLGFESYRFNVFGRDGLACYRCDAVIERRSVGGRNLFVCPGCQAA